MRKQDNSIRPMEAREDIIKGEVTTVNVEDKSILNGEYIIQPEQMKDPESDRFNTFRKDFFDRVSKTRTVEITYTLDDFIKDIKGKKK